MNNRVVLPGNKKDENTKKNSAGLTMEKKTLLELQKQLHDYGKNIEQAQKMLEMQQQWMEQINLSQNETTVNIASEQMSLLEERMRRLDEKLNSLEAAINTGFKIDMKDQFEHLREEVHTDCIKVYRNVQAVVVEENSKQNKVLTKNDHNIRRIKTRMTTVLIFSIISIIASLFVIIMEILPMFGISLIG